MKPYEELEGLVNQVMANARLAGLYLYKVANAESPQDLESSGAALDFAERKLTEHHNELLAYLKTTVEE